MANGGSINSWVAPAGDNVTERIVKQEDPRVAAEELYLERVHADADRRRARRGRELLEGSRQGQTGGRPGTGLGIVEFSRVSLQPLTEWRANAMNVKYACQSPEHAIARRQFLGTMAALGAGACAGGLGVFSTPAIAEQLRSESKTNRRLQHARRAEPARKLGSEAGHRHRRPVPRDSHVGARHSHLANCCRDTAKQMHHLCLVRGVNTSEDDHGKGAYMMLTGRRQNAGQPTTRKSAPWPPRRWRPPIVRCRATSSSRPAAAAAAATTRRTSAPSIPACSSATATRRKTPCGPKA